MVYPRISIITPSFNQGHFIEQTILSVLDQKYPNLDYIIIDGGSTDNSVEIIKKYEKHLSYWISEKDKGQSEAIIKGYNRASGDVINWLNSDDYYEPGALKIISEAFANPSVNVYCGKSRVFGDGIEYYSNGTDLYASNLEKTIGWARIDQPETFMRKSVWDTIGPVDERFHYIMDKELWIRYLLHYGLQGIVKTDTLLAHFRLHAGSKTISQNDHFSKESASLFYSLAKENGLFKEAMFFKENLNPGLISLNYSHTSVDIKKVVTYFFFQQMAQAYAQNLKDRFNLFYKNVDKTDLSNEDRRLYNRLYMRSLVPLFVKRLWNRFNRTTA